MRPSFGYCLPIFANPSAGLFRTPAYRDWSEGYDPNTWLDRAIHATRTEIFPLHGLDPLP